MLSTTYRHYLVATVIAALLVIFFPATPVVPAQATSGNATATAAGSALPAAVKKKLKKNKFFQPCRKPSGRFREHSFGFSPAVVVTGRCLMGKFSGVRRIGSYNGHHPSASKALDVMTNLHGSCTAGRDNGNKMARYLMKNSQRHSIRYIIWKNAYWAAGSGKKPWKEWRKMGRPGCTHGHYDHIHVAFK